MDAQRFDRFTRLVSRRATRRGLLAGALSCAGGVLLGSRRVMAECGPGEVDCHGECRTLTDITNCGACDNNCNYGPFVIPGCCDPGNGYYVCVDLAGNDNCGGCGVICETNSCNQGYCEPVGCEWPLIECDGVCIDPNYDHDNCGGCGIVCAADQSCSVGTCVCPLDGVLCDGTCTDTQWDDFNCGDCGIICPGTTSCCFAECVDLESHPIHCGACASPCGDGEACVAGVCLPISCPPGFTFCSDTCVDLSADLDHCGACGASCRSGLVATACVQGVCHRVDCPAALVDACDGDCCDGECYDPQTDRFNCGQCGFVCGAGEICRAGRCVQDQTCPAGRTLCDDSCVDLQSDERNCGECDVVCPAGEQCVGGKCEPGPIDKWALWNGETKLRGANIFQRIVTVDDPRAMGTGPVGPLYKQTDFDRLAALGANFVDISHPLLVSERAPFTADEDVRENLKHLVVRAAEAGLLSVISIRTGPGLTERAAQRLPVCEAGGCFSAEIVPATSASKLWTDEDAQLAWVDGWRAIAETYKSNPTVVGYNILAAPDAPDVETWRALARMLIVAIREVDAKTPILIGGLAPSGPHDLLDIEPLDDEYLVYRFDQFGPARYLEQDAGVESPLEYPGTFDPTVDDDDGDFDKTWIATTIKPAIDWATKNNLRLAVSAFGVPRWQPGAAGFLSDQMNAFEKADLNHAVWMWYPAGGPVEEDAFNYEHGADPTQHEPAENAIMDLLRDRWTENRPLEAVKRVDSDVALI